MYWDFGRAVVTGGAGFLGSHLCEELIARGTSVVCLDNLSTSSARNLAALRSERDFEFVEHDIARHGYQADGIDLVVHMASPASPADYLRMPLQTLRVGSNGTLNALELAERNGARFLLVSTSEVYGDPLRHPQDESYWGNVNPVGPRAVYDEAKRYAEALTSAFGAHRDVGTRIARVFNSFGPRMRPGDGRVVSTFVCQALRGEAITVNGDGSQTRSLCYVDDTVRGLLAVASGRLATPVNIGRPGEIPVLGLAELVRSLVGSHSPIHHTDAAVDEPRRRCPDISLANAELGWRPEVGVVEGLRRTISWFAAEGGVSAAG
ncbi:dTDP-glucose 4,6-dehydratase [Saccharopolyspora antimicrobica]|uniref:dTDP-glucose 4,6-dehydratase n=1 Tax=Saccharopolyspora antimicrobica TaxID=455193 RepID=A0A1I5KV56_9PSEU|nr:NAD-dependent epimerase/dehydratase family protein [Saccharopolyspora antimicrobica]RKT89115.1 dTDP-glucose 4,6-dehydratase [Saccharopolyspora antimicrobica]SFO88887.1 dTDP-glucose 4,6-dehydratase [Saccharopolyspora antimicrobica]